MPVSISELDTHNGARYYGWQMVDPKRHEAARKGHEKYMNRLNKSILSSQAPKYATALMSPLPTM